MKERIRQVMTNPLFSGSAVMIVGSNTTNFLNYIYHLIMGRLLGPSSYGELAALFSLMGLVGMVPLALGLVIVKYVSSAKTAGEVTSLIDWLGKKIMILSWMMFFSLTLGSFFISSFLKIENPLLIVLIGTTFLVSLPAFFNRSVLQGLLRFKQLVSSILAENTIKLLLGVFLVYLGWAVGGAVMALVVAGLVGWLLSKMFISDYTNTNKPIYPRPKLILSYAFPVLVQSVATTSLFSADLMLVKHFFSPHEAGLYAALSTLGKIIFFASGPIGAVMFPLISQKKAQGKGYRQVFLYSFLLTTILACVILLFYWWFPKVAVNLLYGSLYLEAADLLIWLGIFMTLFTLSSLLISFHLSLGRTKAMVLPAIAAIGQALGIWFYHDSLKTVITVSIVISFFLLASLCLYTLLDTKQRNDKQTP